MPAPIPTCVIYNPAAGRGRARRLFDAARRRHAPDAVFRPTDGPGHAVELAHKAAAEGFARVVAAGGDGTVHEVANGLLAGSWDDVILSVWPVGSMNDYAYTLGIGRWWNEGRTEVPLEVIRVDVGTVRAAGREKYFVNGAGIGFNGMVTLESEKIRYLRGLPLYAVSFFRAMVRHFTTPTLTMRFDDSATTGPTLALSVSLGQREGGFPLTRDARLDDGWFDTVHVGRVKRWELVRYFPALISGNLPTNHAQLRRGRCRSAAASSDSPLCVHTDGELICRPHEGIQAVEIELLPTRLRVEVCRRYMYGR
jgi:diacylglycerol kinase family enzyme